MLERHCLVIEITRDSARLRAEPGSCEGCLGCGGRCSLLPAGKAEILVALADVEGCLELGGRATLSLPKSSLLVEAARGYGLPLLGLLLGAVLGHFVAALLDLPVNASSAAAAFAGTLLSLQASKRGAKPICRSRPLQLSQG